MNWHRFISVGVGIATLSVAPLSASAAVTVILTGNAHTSYGSGNVTYASDGANGIPLAPDGSNSAQVQNPHLLVAATGSANLSNNAIGAACGYLGASVIDWPPTGPPYTGGTKWWLGGTGSTMFRDLITVESTTLAAGTPVQIQFSIHATSSLLAEHTNTPGGDAWAMAFIDMGINITNRGADSFYLDASQHRAIRDNSDGTSENSGVLNPNTPQLSVPFDAQVGDIIAFTVEAEARTSGELAPITVGTNPLVLDNAVSSSKASVGLAFGGTSLTPDVTLSSEKYAAEFPFATSANAANAAAGEPAMIPEPTTLTLLAFGGLAVLGRRRRLDGTGKA